MLEVAIAARQIAYIQRYKYFAFPKAITRHVNFPRIIFQPSLFLTLVCYANGRAGQTTGQMITYLLLNYHIMNPPATDGDSVSISLRPTLPLFPFYGFDGRGEIIRIMDPFRAIHSEKVPSSNKNVAN